MSFQRLKTWKQSRDPNYEAKGNRVLHLYGLMDGTCDVEPGDPEVSHLRRRVRAAQPAAPPGPPVGSRGVAGHSRAGDDAPPTPARTGLRYLLAAYDLSRDKLYGHIRPRKRRAEFLAFVRYVRGPVPAGVRIAIVLDNASAHLSTRRDARVGDWAASHNVKFAYVPTSASFLNRIEALFTALRYFTLDGTDHISHEEQGGMIRRYIAWRHRNAHDSGFANS